MHTHQRESRKEWISERSGGTRFADWNTNRTQPKTNNKQQQFCIHQNRNSTLIIITWSIKVTIVGSRTFLRPDSLKADCPIAFTDLQTRHHQTTNFRSPSYLLTVLLNIKTLYGIKSQYGNKLKHSLRTLKKSRNVIVASINNILPCHLNRNEKSNARKQIIYKSLLRGYPYRLQCFRGIEESIRNESQGGRRRYGSQAGTSVQRTLMKNNKSECLFFITKFTIIITWSIKVTPVGTTLLVRPEL